MGEQVHYQQISGCKSISKESVALDNSNKLQPSTMNMAKFHSHLSDKSDQDASTTATDLHILIQVLISNT